MYGDDAHPDHEGRDEDGSDAGEEDDDDGGDDQTDKGLSVGELTAEEGQRGIGGLTEGIKEKPGGKEGGEEDKGKGISEEGDPEDGRDYDEVIDAKIVIVLAEAEGGIGEGFRLGEGGTIEELGPGTAVGEAGSDCFGDA